MCTLYICVLGALCCFPEAPNQGDAELGPWVMVRRAFASFAGCQDLPGIASYANAKLQDLLQISTRPVS
jgi:hypothetical protein